MEYKEYRDEINHSFAAYGRRVRNHVKRNQSEIQIHILDENHAG